MAKKPRIEKLDLSQYRSAYQKETAERLNEVIDFLNGLENKHLIKLKKSILELWQKENLGV